MIRLHLVGESAPKRPKGCHGRNDEMAYFSAKKLSSLGRYLDSQRLTSPFSFATVTL
jgi:hypothetical protein